MARKPLHVFPVDAEGIPYESREILNTKVSRELETFLLELVTYPGKHPGSIIISEERIDDERKGGPTGSFEVSGVLIITADGKKTFHSYSGGSGDGKGICPMLEPVPLRVGWAVWKPKKDPEDEYELNVRIYGTEEEAIGAVVLHGGQPSG